MVCVGAQVGFFSGDVQYLFDDIGAATGTMPAEEEGGGGAGN